MMVDLEDRITEIEEEIRKTPYNKATQHHIGKLKAKLARLRDELERRTVGKAGRGFAVPRSGHARVSIVGFPSVGKSTLLNQLTSAESDVGEYDFTTLNVIPGLMEYKGAKIQVLDLPGVIEGASKGKGRGREVLSVARSSDLIILMLDTEKRDIDLLVAELEKAGLRLNQHAPRIIVKKKDRGGINLSSTVELTKLEPDLIPPILREWGYANADVVIRSNISEKELIDFLSGNKAYVPAIAVLNKVDLLDQRPKRPLRISHWKALPISALRGDGLAELRKHIHSLLKLIRVYLKPKGKEPDYSEPLVLRRGSTVGMVCDAIHRDFRKKFRYATIWGKSARFPGQTVGLEHVLKDQDVVTIVVRR